MGLLCFSCVYIFLFAGLPDHVVVDGHAGYPGLSQTPLPVICPCQIVLYCPDDCFIFHVKSCSNKIFVDPI